MHDLSDLPRAEGLAVPERLDRAPAVTGEYSAWLPRHSWRSWTYSAKQTGTAAGTARVLRSCGPKSIAGEAERTWRGPVPVRSG